MSDFRQSKQVHDFSTCCNNLKLMSELFSSFRNHLSYRTRKDLNSCLQPFQLHVCRIFGNLSRGKESDMVSGGGESPTIVKPRNDDREYKRVLLSNGLQVLLVSDPDTDKVMN